MSHKRDSILLALRTVLLWGVLFVFLFRKPIGIHNGLHHNIHIILCQLAAGKQTSYFICELLRLFGASCAVLFRSLSNVYTGFDFLAQLNLPSTFYNMLPYIISLLVLALTSSKSRAPKAEGIPYDKGSR